MELISGFFEYVLPFLVVLSIVVFVHEYGHFIIARLCGVKVDVFSIGFGKELWGYDAKNGTRWKICAIPMGGYVKMFGDADEASATVSEESAEFTEEEKAVSFRHQNVAKRSAIVSAGPITNFIFAIMVFAITFATIGQRHFSTEVGKIMENSAAEEAGFAIGDKIIKINDTDINRFADIQRIVRISHGATLQFIVIRDGRELLIPATPRLSKEIDGDKIDTEMAVLGIGSNPVAEGESYKRLPPLEAVATAFETTYGIVSDTLVALKQMIMGTRSTKELGGPIRIAEISGDVAKAGFVGYVNFIAMLSVCLGLFNLFPIPLLDGGHLVFYAIEGILQRPLTEKVQEICLKFGMGLLLGLMVLATWNDITRIFERVFT
ncbi:MAG: RIP metalloprotease RseP [Alphaproteobacteria bacterium]|nr:RIP metalloprotease RseP [Alphaproteobacteria bacterium]